MSVPAAAAPVFTSSSLITILHNTAGAAVPAVTATNGATFSITGGSLSGSGLTLNSDGTWSGTATQASGMQYYDVVVTANNGQTATQNLRLAIAANTANTVFIANSFGNSTYQQPTSAGGSAIIDPNLVVFGTTANVIKTTVTIPFVIGDNLSFNGLSTQTGNSSVQYPFNGGFYLVSIDSNQIDVTVKTDGSYSSDSPTGAPLADMQAVMRLIGFHNNLPNGTGGLPSFPRTVTATFSVANPANATTSTKTIDVELAPGAILSIAADASATQAEGNSGTKNFTFTVSRSGDTTGSTTVDWASSGTGTRPASAADIQGGFLSGQQLSWGPNDTTTRTITITVFGDTAAEFDETFSVTLSNVSPGTATISNPTAVGTIQNDDPIFLNIAELDSDKPEGSSGLTPYTFRITRSGDTTGTTSFTLAYTGGTATASDFDGGSLPNGTLTFNPGETQMDVTVNIVGDTTVEPDELFVMTLSNASNTPAAPITLLQSGANGQIRNDDINLAIATLDSSKNEGNSGSTPFTFRITRTGLTTGTTTVNYSVTGSGGSPADAADFTGGTLPTNVPVTFNPGETEKDITINVNGDTTAEATETFTVTLSNPSAPAAITTATAIGTIVTDDTSFSVATLSSSNAEGNSGNTAFTFRITRGGDTTGSASVQYSVAGSGANQADAADFGGSFPTNVPVTFGTGIATVDITINVSGDTAVEPNETFSVTLSSPSVGVITGSPATGTIVNDDSAFSIAAASANNNEGNSGNTAFTFTISRTGDTSAAATVQYSVTGTGGNPADATDFGGSLPTNVTVNFTGGQTSTTITINVSGDTTVEQTETFLVTLSNPSVGGITGSPATGTIINDDSTFSIATLDSSKNEGNSGNTAFTFNINRTGDTSAAATVLYTVAGSGANPANAADFGGTLPTNVTANFSAGATQVTITINVSGDTTLEQTETFTVTLSSPSTGVVTGSPATGTIINDDSTFAIAVNNASRPEGNSGNTAFTFDITRTGDTSAAATVNYSVTGTGANPADAADFGGSLPTNVVASFAAGATSTTVTINVSGDTTVEQTETFQVTLSNPSLGVVTGSPATGTILNDDSAFSIAANNANRSEGNSGNTGFTFDITRTGDTSAAATVNYSVTGSGANPADAADFGGSLPTNVVANFAAGATLATVTINVSGDTAVESTETFAVTLSSPSLGIITGSTATGTIVNDDSAFSIAALDASKNEGNSGNTGFTFTVSRSGDLSAAATVNYSVTGSGGNPADAADFGGSLPTNVVVNFSAGSPSVVVTINVSGDTAVEQTEGFTVTLSNPSLGIISGATATGSIVNDDAAFSIAALAANRAEGNSGPTAFTFTVSRTGDTSAAASVNYSVTGSGANPANAADFGGSLPTNVNVPFGAGASSVVVTINVSGDTSVEQDETFTVTLSNPSAGTGIGTATAIGTIVNDDTAFSIAALSANKAEGNSGPTAFTFTVSRTGDTSAAATVNYSVTGSGGLDAADFGGTLPTNVQVSLGAGIASTTVTINVNGDTTIEADENFTVTLSSPSTGVLGTATATGTIVNDDSSFSIAALSANNNEGNSGNTAFTFTVTRTGATPAATVNYSVTGSGGLDAADFGGSLPTNVPVSFASGATSATVTINVSGDTVVEADENFTVTLSNPSSGVIGTATATGTIVNDDSAFSIAALSAVNAEGNSGPTAFTFTINRTGVTPAATVNYSVTGSGGLDAADFGGTLPTSVPVSFASGATSVVVTINVAGDTIVETDESFSVTLSSPSSGIVAGSPATGTIQNDDSSFSIAALSAVKNEGNTATTPFTFTVSRTGDLSAAATVSYSVTGSGGLDAADFGGTLPTNVPVNFAAGASSVVITIDVTGDSVVETNETFTVTLSNPTVGTITGATATGTINNDDSTTLSIAALSAVKNEGNTGTTPFTFTITRGGDTSGTTTVNYAVTGGATNPADAADFGGAFPTGSVSFAATETVKTITINVTADTTAENDDTFVVTLSGASSPAIIATPTANGTIQNDDVPSLSTTTALSIVQSSPSTGYVVNLTAVVTPTPSGPPPLEVTFRNGNNVIATVPLTGNTATVNNVVVAAGTNVITATFSGNALYLGSTGTATYTPGKFSTTTTLATSNANAAAGAPVTFTATTTSANGMPGGTVVFYRNGSAISGAVNLIDGKATFTTSTLPVGSGSITAVYSGNAAYSTSTTSTPITQVVGATVNTGNLATASFVTSGKLVSTVIIRNTSGTTLSGGFVLELPTIGGSTNYSLASANLYVNGVRGGPLEIDTTSGAARIKIPSSVPPGSTTPYPIVASLAPNASITLELKFVTGTTPLSQATTPLWRLYYGQ